VAAPRLQAAGGDDRPIEVIRAAVAADLILRPWDQSRSPPTSPCTPRCRPSPPTATSRRARSAQLVTAAQCRDLLRQLDLLGVRAAPYGGSASIAVQHPATGRLIAVATRREVRRGATGTRRRRRRGADLAGTTHGAGVDTSTRRPVDTATS
jgi:hypothetical protein